MSPMGAASVEFIDPREPIAVCVYSLKLLFFFFPNPKSLDISRSWLLSLRRLFRF